MKNLYLLIAALTCLSSPLMAWRPVSGLATSSYSTPRTDEEIFDSIRIEIEARSKSNTYRSIIIHVSHGIVTLTGSVDSQLDRQNIIDLVRSEPGVRDVINQLRIAFY